MLNGYHRMLTAGHCAWDGGYVWSHAGAPNFNSPGTVGMGCIYSGGQFENWNQNVGTTMINGRYDGDMAMITLDLNNQGGFSIYTGAASGDNTSAIVKEMWWRSPLAGDQFCTGGHATGSLCGWQVSVGNANVTVAGGLVQNVARSFRTGCVQGGDSGGSVYTVRPDGGIAAKGIMSQANTATPCEMLFTDVRRAAGAWPGLTLNVIP